MKIKLFITTVLTALILLSSACSTGNKAPVSSGQPVKSEKSQPQTTIAENTETPENIKNISVCIDAGHGITSRKEKEPISPDSDELKAANVSGTAGEEAFNLDIALRLKSRLESNGIYVDMTRTEHECDKSNIDRALQANESNYCIRIHADGNSDSTIHGISVLIPEKSYYEDNSFVAESTKLGQSVLDSLISHTNAQNNGLVTRSDLTGFNWSKVPVILIECGFMTNPDERELLESDEYKSLIANAIANGFLNYINNQDN